MKKALVFLSIFAIILTVSAGDYYGYGNRRTRRRSNSYSSQYTNPYTIPTYGSQPRQGTYDNTRHNPYSYTEKRTGNYGQTYYVGPQGGEYYINRSGNETYYNRQPSNLTPVFQGSKGGNYYYNSNGNKVYIRKK